MAEQPQTETTKQAAELKVPPHSVRCDFINTANESVAELELSAAEIHHITDSQLAAVHGASKATCVVVYRADAAKGTAPYERRRVSVTVKGLQEAHRLLDIHNLGQWPAWGPVPTRRDRSKRPVFHVDTIISREPRVVATIADALSSALGVSVAGIAELVYNYSHHTLAYADRERFQATHDKLADGPSYDTASPAEQLAMRTAADAAARAFADKHKALESENRQEDMRILVRRLNRLAAPASPRHRDAYDSYSDAEETVASAASAGCKRKAESQPPQPQEEVQPPLSKRPRGSGSDDVTVAAAAAAAALASLQEERKALEKTEYDLIAKRSRQIREDLTLIASETAALESQIGALETWLSL